MRFLKGVTLAFAVLAALASSAAAERRVAFVVGNADYATAGRLNNPINDASDVRDKLDALGFEVVAGLDLDGDAFAEAIDRFSEAVAGADVALFYYSGHGVQLDGQNYLLPVDITADDEIKLKRQAFALDDIIRRMESAAKLNLVFLDACRDNPLVPALQAETMAAGRSVTLGRGLSRMDNRGGNTLIVFATSPGTVASDGDGRNSPFTAAFLDNVATPGIDVEVLMKRVTAAVLAATGSAQKPQRLSELTAEFAFVPGDVLAPAPEPAEPAPVAIAATGDAGRDARRRQLVAIVEDGPRVVETRGKNGSVYVEGTLTRVDIDVWHEKNTENGDAILAFVTMEQTKDRVLLFDRSRGLWLSLDLKRGKTAWRLDGQTKWHPLYDIVAVSR